MSIISSEKKRFGYKLVGASLPLQVHNYLTLYALAKGTTKTKIIKHVIEGWINTQKAKEADTFLIADIVKKVNHQWLIEKASGKVTSFKRFKETLQEELIQKGITGEYLTKILNSIKNDAEN